MVWVWVIDALWMAGAVAFILRGEVMLGLLVAAVGVAAIWSTLRK